MRSVRKFNKNTMDKNAYAYRFHNEFSGTKPKKLPIDLVNRRFI